MAKIINKLNRIPKGARVCLVLGIFILVGSGGIHFALAAWTDPGAVAPSGNIYAPLNTGADKQAKRGKLLLDPLFNPLNEVPTLSYQLEVRGTKNVSINYLDVSGGLTVDTNTLYVKAGSNTGDGLVGVGTTDPSTKLDVVGGNVYVGSNDTAITSASIGSDKSAVFGQTESTSDLASILGENLSGANSAGIYGYNSSAGPGIYAENGAADNMSAVRAENFRPYYSTVTAAIYGKAGPVGWAGYFEQRLYSNQRMVGRKFTANSLPNSQIPYTANWQTRPIPESEVKTPWHTAFDGKYLWVTIPGDYNYIDIMDPSTGLVIKEFQPTGAPSIDNLMYAEGSIWGASTCSDRPCLIKFNTTTLDRETSYLLDAASGSAIDQVYDNAGHIWTANSVEGQTSVSRLTIADGSLQAPAFTVAAQCSSQTLGAPSGIAYDGVNIWITFPNAPMALGKFLAASPYTATVNCTDLVDHGPGDVTYDSYNNHIWVSYTAPNGATNAGVGRYNLDATRRAEYLYNVPVGSNLNFAGGINQIKFDNISSGGPFIWFNNSLLPDNSYIFKYNIDGVGTFSAVSSYILPETLRDFTFDRTTSGGPYVWGTAYYGEVTRDVINNPNTPYSTKFYNLSPGQGDGLDMVYDGTNVWVANSQGFTVSKFRAADGQKIGDYYAGRKPRQLIYDGQYLWAINHYGPSGKRLNRIDATNGQLVGEYDRLISEAGNDAVYDGKDIWIVNGNVLYRIRLSLCTSSGSTCAGSGPTAYTMQYTFPTTVNPYRITFDGKDLWVSYNTSDNQSNKISKVSFSDSGITGITATYTFSEISGAQISGQFANINAMEYDGTFIWLGTQMADANGNSVYKINPSDGTVVAKFPIYHEPGRCSATDSPANLANKYCSKALDCSDGITNGTCLSSITPRTALGCESNGVCRGMMAGVSSLVYDGINMWVGSGTGIDYPIRRECYDQIDNDNNSSCDAGGCCSDQHWRSDNINQDRTQCLAICGSDCWLPADTKCQNTYDLHETATANECNDNLDNDGNGLCDYDGAAGSPGCSGKRDPGCVSAADISESTEGNTTFLTRILAAKNQIVDSVVLDSTLGFPETYNNINKMVFDGTHIWLGGLAYDGLYQYYSGSGQGVTEQSGSVTLYGSNALKLQSGSVSLSGSATIGGSFTVVGDLVVANNVWGGTESVKTFGTGCDNGQFAKGIAPGDTTGLNTWGSSIAIDATNMYVFGKSAENHWRTEKRALSNGDLDTNFGSNHNGIVLGDTTSQYGNDIAIVAPNMYLVGTDTNGHWRIEKRLLSDGSPDQSFGTGGVITSVIGEPRGIAANASGIFVVGTSGGNWHAEKYLLSGAVDNSFGSGGVIVGDPTTFWAYDVAINSNYLFIVGADDDSNWRVEKYTIGGLICSNARNCEGSHFGNNGVVTRGSGAPAKLSIDSASMYVVGNESTSTWRVDKLSLITGDGDVGFDGDGTALITGADNSLLDIAIDTAVPPAMYIVGGRNWRIEKHLLSDFSRVNAFDGDGIITIPNVQINFSVFGTAVDASYLYTVGRDPGLNWRIEKRSRTDGSLITTFGNNGVATYDSKLFCHSL